MVLVNIINHVNNFATKTCSFWYFSPTTVELCRSSFEDIIDKLKANLAYFKDDFRNIDMFKAIPKPMGNTPCPRSGLGASTLSFLDASTGGPGSTTPRGNPPSSQHMPRDQPSTTPRNTLVPPSRNTPVPLPRNTPVPPPRNTPLSSPRSTPVPSL